MATRPQTLLPPPVLLPPPLVYRTHPGALRVIAPRAAPVTVDAPVEEALPPGAAIA